MLIRNCFHLPELSFTLDARFLAGFLAVDFCGNLVVSFRTLASFWAEAASQAYRIRHLQHQDVLCCCYWVLIGPQSRSLGLAADGYPHENVYWLRRAPGDKTVVECALLSGALLHGASH